MKKIIGVILIAVIVLSGLMAVTATAGDTSACQMKSVSEGKMADMQQSSAKKWWNPVSWFKKGGCSTTACPAK